MLTDLANGYSTHTKQKICLLDHPKNLVEVLLARLVISHGFIGNNITMETNQYRINRTFHYGEALRIFDLKSIELRHQTVANIIVVMNHVVAYFGPKYCLSNQKRYIRYKMEKPCKLTTRQYVGLVSDLNSRMTHISPLFDENQELNESKLVDYLAIKVPRIHKAMIIYQGFNTEAGYLATFVEQKYCAKTTDNIAVAKFSTSDNDSNTKRKKYVPN